MECGNSKLKLKQLSVSDHNDIARDREERSLAAMNLPEFLMRKADKFKLVNRSQRREREREREREGREGRERESFHLFLNIKGEVQHFLWFWTIVLFTNTQTHIHSFTKIEKKVTKVTDKS